MSAKSFNWVTWLTTMLLLFVGELFGNIIVQLLMLENVWLAVFIVSLIQALIIIVAGLAQGGKQSWVAILILAVIIMVTGIVAGLLVSFVGATDYVAMLLKLAIQALVLMFSGYIKSRKSR